jgi:hypothetical protein
VKRVSERWWDEGEQEEGREGGTWRREERGGDVRTRKPLWSFARSTFSLPSTFFALCILLSTSTLVKSQETVSLCFHFHPFEL